MRPFGLKLKDMFKSRRELWREFQAGLVSLGVRFEDGILKRLEGMELLISIFEVRERRLETEFN
jgi:hypothetical protein